MNLKQNWLKEHGFLGKEEELGQVLTTKEIEKLYGLPDNKVLQDIKRGFIKSSEYRQSGKIWLVTRREANKQYSGYVKPKKRGRPPKQSV